MVARAKPRSQTRTRTVHKDLSQPGANGGDLGMVAMFYHKKVRHEKKLEELRDEGKALNRQMQNAGIVMKDFKLARELFEMEHDHAVEVVKRIKHYAEGLGAPIAKQLDLFGQVALGEAAARKGALDKAYAYGKFVGADMDGGMIDNRYDGDQELHQAALRGFQESQGETIAKWMEIQTADKKKEDQAAQEKADRAAARKKLKDERDKAKADKKAKREAKKADIKPKGKKAAKPKPGDGEADDPNGPVH